MTAVLEPAEHTALRLLWVDLTRKCQLGCVHCLNDSGAEGTHGTMSRPNWISVLDQAKTSGVSEVRFIGGEVTMHPDAADLVGHALDLGLQVEIFSNLVHITARWWELFQREGASVATSYHSDDAAEHDTITGRRSHARTLANISKAASVGPTGEVSPCVFSTWMRVGDVRDASLADILSSAEMVRANAFIQAAHDPEEEELDDDDECSPGFPGSGCGPRK